MSHLSSSSDCNIEVLCCYFTYEVNEEIYDFLPNIMVHFLQPKSKHIMTETFFIFITMLCCGINNNTKDLEEQVLKGMDK